MRVAGVSFSERQESLLKSRVKEMNGNKFVVDSVGLVRRQVGRLDGWIESWFGIVGAEEICTGWSGIVLSRLWETRESRWITCRRIKGEVKKSALRTVLADETYRYH